MRCATRVGVCWWWLGAPRWQFIIHVTMRNAANIESRFYEFGVFECYAFCTLRVLINDIHVSMRRNVIQRFSSFLLSFEYLEFSHRHVGPCAFYVYDAVRQDKAISFFRTQYFPHLKHLSASPFHKMFACCIGASDLGIWRCSSVCCSSRMLIGHVVLPQVPFVRVFSCIEWGFPLRTNSISLGVACLRAAEKRSSSRTERWAPKKQQRHHEAAHACDKQRLHLIRHGEKKEQIHHGFLQLSSKQQVHVNLWGGISRAASGAGVLADLLNCFVRRRLLPNRAEQHELIEMEHDDFTQVV